MDGRWMEIEPGLFPRTDDPFNLRFSKAGDGQLRVKSAVKEPTKIKDKRKERGSVNGVNR